MRYKVLIGIAIQFIWWMVDKGVTGLSGDTSITTLMIRHNTLRGYDIIQNNFEMICINRLLVAVISIAIVILSVWILSLKRKGKINVSNVYRRCFGNMQKKFPLMHKR